MKKVIFVLLISAISIIAQQKDSVVILKDSTLVKLYDQRIQQLYFEWTQIAQKLADENPEAREKNGAVKELQFLRSEEVKKQTIKKVLK